MSPARVDRGARRAAVRAFGIGLCLAVLAASAAGSRAWADDAKPEGQDDDKLKTLLRTRLEVAQNIYNLRMEEYKAGKIAPDGLLEAGKQLFKSQLDLAEKKEDRVAACQKNLERWTQMKNMADTKYNAGLLTKADVQEVEYERLEAEILLEKEKAK
jgi:outer membrane protein TolC